MSGSDYNTLHLKQGCMQDMSESDCDTLHLEQACMYEDMPGSDCVAWHHYTSAAAPLAGCELEACRAPAQRDRLLPTLQIIQMSAHTRFLELDCTSPNQLQHTCCTGKACVVAKGACACVCNYKASECLHTLARSFREG